MGVKKGEPLLSSRAVSKTRRDFELIVTDRSSDDTKSKSCTQWLVAENMKAQLLAATNDDFST